MKSKTPLTLMELLVMILIFSIAAALCTRIFVTADRWSRENELKDRAVISSQTAAETLKAMDGDLNEAAELLGGTVTKNQWVLLFDEDGRGIVNSEEAVYAISVEKIDSGHAYLGMASVTARTMNDREELFRITVAWQEVERNE